MVAHTPTIPNRTIRPVSTVKSESCATGPISALEVHDVFRRTRAARNRPTRPRSARILHRHVDRSFDDVEGTLAHLVVDAADILTKHADSRELHAADEQHQHGDGRDAHRVLIAMPYLESYDDKNCE